MTADTVTLERADAVELMRCAKIGDVILGWLAATVQLGHSSPADTLDYMHTEPDSAQAFVADFIAWTGGRKSKAPGCEERMREFAAIEASDRVDRAAS